jgi:hypothetical protein
LCFVLFFDSCTFDVWRFEIRRFQHEAVRSSVERAGIRVAAGCNNRDAITGNLVLKVLLSIEVGVTDVMLVSQVGRAVSREAENRPLATTFSYRDGVGPRAHYATAGTAPSHEAGREQH